MLVQCSDLFLTTVASDDDPRKGNWKCYVRASIQEKQKEYIKWVGGVDLNCAPDFKWELNLILNAVAMLGNFYLRRRRRS